MPETWLPNRMGQGRARPSTSDQCHFRTIDQLLDGTRVTAVGHRVVHGGTHFSAPTRVGDEVMKALRKLCPLAPLHQPHNLAAIEAITAMAPHAPGRLLRYGISPQSARAGPGLRTPSPHHRGGSQALWFSRAVVRIYRERLSETNPELARGRLLVAHLGNGASLCALKNGHSVATTMGFTAVDGLMMGTRCGSIDPGVILYLMDERRWMRGRSRT